MAAPTAGAGVNVAGTEITPLTTGIRS
jgi:hypothetical protein